MTTPLKPMLAKDGDLATVQFPLIVQAKLDGIRATVQGGRLLSRTLKEIPNGEIRAMLARPEFEGLDGEIVVGDPTAEDAYRRTASFVMAPNKIDEPWMFHVFDKIDMGDAPYYTRYHEALEAVASATGRGWPLTMIEGERAETLADLERLEAEFLAEGHEGVIARVENAPYKHGRSGKKGPLLKVKRFVDFEAEVIGVYEEMHNANEAKTNELGRTARSSHKAGKVGKGTLGGLIVKAINGDYEGVEFRVGTGFTAAMRERLWDMHTVNTDFPGQAAEPPVVGRTAKLKYFPIGVKDKPRHPVFLGWRDMEVDG